MIESNQAVPKHSTAEVSIFNTIKFKDFATLAGGVGNVFVFETV